MGVTALDRNSQERLCLDGLCTCTWGILVRVGEDLA